MGISKINTLSYIKDKGLYSELTFQKYKYLFNYFQTDVNFISHGNISNWIDILSCLPSIETSHVNFSNGAIRIGHPSEIGLHGKKILEEKLLELSPWRKGPFILFGTEIDSAWRSYKKWNRIKPFLPFGKGIRICDIGCSNGYYLYKLLETEPEIAIGVERTPLYIMQFLATKFMLRISKKF